MKEMEALNRHEQMLEQIKPLKEQVMGIKSQLVDNSMKLDNLKEVPRFIETGLPLWNMYQISEAIHKVFIAKPKETDIAAKLREYQFDTIKEAMRNE